MVMRERGASIRFRIFLTVLVFVLVGILEQRITRDEVPDWSREAAVGQLEDSEEAYGELQLHEQTKDYAVVAPMVFLAVCVIAIWCGPVIRAGRSAFKEGCR